MMAKLPKNNDRIRFWISVATGLAIVLVAILVTGCSSSHTAVSGGSVRTLYKSTVEKAGEIKEEVKDRFFDEEGNLVQETDTIREVGPVEKIETVSEGEGQNPDILTSGDGKTEADTDPIQMSAGPEGAKGEGGGLTFLGELVAKAGIPVLYGTAAILMFFAAFLVWRKRWKAAAGAAVLAGSTVALAVTASNSPWILILAVLGAIAALAWVVWDFWNDRKKTKESKTDG